MTIAAQFELPQTVHPNLELTAEVVDSFFGAFKTKFNKVYEHEQEEAERRTHFEASLKRAQARNAGKPDEEHTFGVTKFSDMSVEEFKGTMLTYKAGEHGKAEAMTATSRTLRGSTFAATASDKDWRDDGAVTAVKDQGQCGSCWAFSTAEQIESQYFMQGSDLTELSIAQIVQCDTGGDDAGCRGGDTITAYDYVTKAGGLATEKDYPYEGLISHGVTGKCASGFSPVSGTSVKSWTYATPECTSRTCNNQDEDTLASNLSTMGPASICVDAEPWQDYSKGVLKASDCASGYNDLDHCVQLIGYSGIDSSNGYWIVRNSWASDWGVDGMIHLEYGANTCGVADEATFVTLE
jgi:C1A family cysteine protease